MGHLNIGIIIFIRLCYDFASEQWEGLATYYKYCYELGFLPKPVSIGLWSENKERTGDGMKNLMEIYTRKKKDIAAIEKELEESVYTDHAMLRETSMHLLKAGGKRIRPVFVLLSGEFGSYQLQTMKHVAVPLELIHMASLVHDDVIDDANTRRGQLTVRSKWDNRIAMFTGDYIFAKALGVITQIPKPAVHQIMSKAIVEMSIGEMEQIRFFFHSEQTIRDYLLRIRRKTALLNCHFMPIRGDGGGCTGLGKHASCMILAIT